MKMTDVPLNDSELNLIIHILRRHQQNTNEIQLLSKATEDYPDKVQYLIDKLERYLQA